LFSTRGILHISIRQDVRKRSDTCSQRIFARSRQRCGIKPFSGEPVWVAQWARWLLSGGGRGNLTSI